MDDNEELLELNRLVSGEMPEDESLTLQKRMLQDPELRAEYERLQEVDALAREAYLQRQSPSAGQEEAPELVQVPHDDRRLQHIEDIIGQIHEAAIVRQRRHSVRFPRLPWGIAAALLVAVGLSLVAGPRLVEWGRSRRASVAPLSSERVAHYAQLRQKLGDNVVIIWRNEAGTYKNVSGEASRPVVVRVTVVRTEGEVEKQWTADAVVPQNETVEMVTGGNGTWPSSIRVGVKAAGQESVPVSIQAQMVRGESSGINLTADVPSSEAVSVGKLQVGAAQYEVIVQAKWMTPGSQAM